MSNNIKENFDALLEKCVTPNASGRECFSLAMLTDDDLKWMAENCPSWDWLSDVTDDGGNNLYDLCAEKGFIREDGEYPMIESDDGKFYSEVITDGGDGSLFYPNHGAIVAKWQDTDIDIAFIDMALYALYGWNGEKYLHCWKCVDRFTADPDGKEYEVTPVYDWEAWNDENGEFQDANGNAIDGIIGYEVA